MPDLFIDISSIPFDDRGVVGFYWPVSYAELASFRDEVALSLVAELRGPLEEKRPGAVELACLSLYLLMDALALFRAQAAIQRAQAAGCRLHIPQGARLSQALAKNAVPYLPPYVDAWRQAQAGRAVERLLCGLFDFWNRRRVYSPARDLNGREFSAPDLEKPIHQHPFALYWAKDRIIATKRGDLLDRAAREAGEPVLLARHRQWFAPLAPEASHGLPGEMAALALRILREQFDRAAVSFPGHVEEYFRRYLDQTGRITCGHLRRLAARPGLLPARLWTGTCGNYWDRLLRVAVRAHGGEASGHSHANGGDHVLSQYVYFNEFFACDRFVVYNETQADIARNHCDRRFLFGPLPRVVSPRPENRPQPVARRYSRPGEGLRVMVVTTHYLGDRINLDPMPLSDVVSLDWQARLFRHLMDAGYIVMHKPHPQSPQAPPEWFGRMGVATVSGYFENVLDQADVFLFDGATMSSTFNYAVKAGVPVVLVNLGVEPWLPAALAVLRKRCAVVEAGFAGDNQVTLDWESLDAAIRLAPTLTDHEFVTRFLA